MHGLYKDGVGGKKAIGHIPMHADNASCVRDVETGVLWDTQNIRRTPCAKVSPKNISLCTDRWIKRSTGETERVKPTPWYRGA